MMHKLSKAEFEVLNAAGDDFENLEQIYRLACTEFSSEHYRPADASAYWRRERAGALPLGEIADAILPLVKQGLLEGRTENGEVILANSDPSLVWKGWFHTTPAGLAARDAAVEYHSE